VHSQVALERFIDAIGTYAIERSLISKLPYLFTPTMVQDMELAKITRIVGESDETTIERTKLDETLKILEAGLQSLRRLHRRKDGGAFTVTQQTPQTLQTPNGVTIAAAEEHEVKAPRTPSSEDGLSEPGPLRVVETPAHSDVEQSFASFRAHTKKGSIW